MMNKAEKITKLNRMMSLCLHACKRYKGQYEIVQHVKQAMVYLKQAANYLNRDLVATYRLLIRMANLRIKLAFYAKTAKGAIA